MADFGDLRGEPWCIHVLFWAFIFVMSPVAMIADLLSGDD